MRRKGKRDTHFFMRFNLGAEVAWSKFIFLDKKMPSRKQIAMVVRTRVLIDWTVDDHAVDKGGDTCELSLKQVMALDEDDGRENG